jgi:hypothetical protein
MWLGVGLFASAGCSKEFTCYDHGDCAEGEGCVEEVCQAVECVSSATCELSTYCDLRSYTCKNGCETDDDCVAGQECNGSNQCVAYGCRDTQLDCYYNEVCNLNTGTCDLSQDAHCKPCSSSLNCGAGECFSFDTAADTYCLLECEADLDCPRGYTCAQATEAPQLYCTAWCPTYDDLGLLPW